MGNLVLLGGGMRSGKSRFALELAESRGERRCFVATGRITDDEMRERILRHQRERGDRYRTVECPVDLAAAIVAAVDVDVVVVDCLTFLIANLLEQSLSNDEILARIDDVTAAIAGSSATVIVVSNEVGMGLVSMSAVGRRFQDLTGWAHQRLAAAASEIYVAMMGSILRLRPAPLIAVDRMKGTA
jgi:adenosylcobinamide kinase / adenosylcobinamide-phosphate guanylyltransferase